MKEVNEMVAHPHTHWPSDYSELNGICSIQLFFPRWRIDFLSIKPYHFFTKILGYLKPFSRSAIPSSKLSREKNRKRNQWTKQKPLLFCLTESNGIEAQPPREMIEIE